MIFSLPVIVLATAVCSSVDDLFLEEFICMVVLLCFILPDLLLSLHLTPLLWSFRIDSLFGLNNILVYTQLVSNHIWTVVLVSLLWIFLIVSWKSLFFTFYVMRSNWRWMVLEKVILIVDLLHTSVRFLLNFLSLKFIIELPLGSWRRWISTK